jgi:hypothetical protein
MEGPKQRLFDVVWNSHVILDCIQCSQYEVEETNLHEESNYHQLARIGQWLTVLARSPSTSLMTAEKLLLVESKKSQHLLIVALSHPDAGCSWRALISRFWE